jgi:hypothetical protein
MSDNVVQHFRETGGELEGDLASGAVSEDGWLFEDS